MLDSPSVSSMQLHVQHGNCLIKFLTEIPSISKFITLSISSSKHLQFSTLSPPPPPRPPLPSLDDDPIVTTAVSILKHHPSKSRWNHLLTTTPLITPSQFSQIILLLRNTPHLAFRFFQFTLQHSLCTHTPSSYATIIHTLSRARHKNKALNIIKSTFQKFEPHPMFDALVKTYKTCDSAPFVFDLFINSCIHTKRVDEAVEVVKMLKRKKTNPNIHTCNGLIELVVKCEGSFAGYDLYREIVTVPNVNTFNVIMVGFYREGLVEKVEEVWVEMERVECVADAYSYSIVMAAYCDVGRMDDSMRVWEGMEKKGVEKDVVTYNTMIGGFCGVGEMERAEVFFRDMVMSGIEGTSVTFECLVKGYCKVGDVDSALLLYKDMGNKGFRPESSTVDAVISLLCEKREINMAVGFFRVARKEYDSNLSKKSYELLVEGLCVEGKIDEALRLQVDMVGKGYEPDSKIYDFFIDGYMDQGNEEMAEKLRKECLNIGLSQGKT